MIYLTLEDIYPYLKQNLLEDIIQDTITSASTINDFSILTEIDSITQGIIKAYIDNVYSFDNLLQIKDPFFTKLFLDVFIFNIEQRCSYDKIPEHRIIAYNDTIKTLEKIATNKLSPSTFPKKNENYEYTNCFKLDSEISINYKY